MKLRTGSKVGKLKKKWRKRRTNKLKIAQTRSTPKNWSSSWCRRVVEAIYRCRKGTPYNRGVYDWVASRRVFLLWVEFNKGIRPRRRPRQESCLMCLFWTIHSLSVSYCTLNFLKKQELKLKTNFVQNFRVFILHFKLGKGLYYSNTFHLVILYDE